VATTVVTWNLRGRRRPDLDAVAAELAARRPDVVALQEVQRRQAGAIARLLGWAPGHWSFKHWPLVAWPEGLAVLAPGGVAGSAVRTIVLSRGAPRWSWRRRIAQLARIDDVAGLVIANVHLATEARARVAQARRLAGAVPAHALVAGDLNARTGSDTLAVLRDAGWTAADAPGIDHVLVPRGARVVTVDAPRRGAFAALSDHAPVTVTVDTSQTAATP